MGTASGPLPVKLITALMARDTNRIGTTARILADTYGPIDSESEVYPFSYSGYYQREMGTPLVKQFISFRDLVYPDRIAAIKGWSNNLELDISGSHDQNGRMVNIDPGYLNDAKLVLATTKDFSHRIYLSNGIYAETTLEYRKGAFRVYPWTYPDYRSGLALTYFSQVRDLFMEQR